MACRYPHFSRIPDTGFGSGGPRRELSGLCVQSFVALCRFFVTPLQEVGDPRRSPKNQTPCAHQPRSGDPGAPGLAHGVSHGKQCLNMTSSPVGAAQGNPNTLHKRSTSIWTACVTPTGVRRRDRPTTRGSRRGLSSFAPTGLISVAAQRRIPASIQTAESQV